MNEYKGNSHRSKEEASNNEVMPVKKVERVATGKTRKKNEVRKFADAFISEDVLSAGSAGRSTLELANWGEISSTPALSRTLALSLVRK